VLRKTKALAKPCEIPNLHGHPEFFNRTLTDACCARVLSVFQMIWRQTNAVPKILSMVAVMVYTRAMTKRKIMFFYLFFHNRLMEPFLLDVQFEKQ
jgi:hypothetical protein